MDIIQEVVDIGEGSRSPVSLGVLQEHMNPTTGSSRARSRRARLERLWRDHVVSLAVDPLRGPAESLGAFEMQVLLAAPFIHRNP
jgi:hypothetical protein